MLNAQILWNQSEKFDYCFGNQFMEWKYFPQMREFRPTNVWSTSRLFEHKFSTWNLFKLEKIKIQVAMWIEKKAIVDVVILILTHIPARNVPYTRCNFLLQSMMLCMNHAAVTNNFGFVTVVCINSSRLMP